MLRQRVRDLYRSFIRAPVGTDSDRAASSVLSRLQQKKQELWEEAVNSIHISHSSCTAWRTINKLTVRSGRSSHLWPVSANSIASQLVKKGTHGTGAASPRGTSTSSCPTYGKSKHLNVTVSLIPLGRSTLLLPSGAWSQESLRDSIPSSRRLYFTPGRLSNLSFGSFSLPACAISRFQISG